MRKEKSTRRKNEKQRIAKREREKRNKERKREGLIVTVGKVKP